MKRIGHEENSQGEVVANYSDVPAINRVYNSIIPGSGLTGADVERVKKLIGGISSETICASFDSEQRRAAKDSVSQSRAIKTALDRMGLNSIQSPSRDEMHERKKDK